MIKQGKVIEQEKNKVKIEIYPEGGCESCQLKGVCRPQNGIHVMELSSFKKFEKGDEVEISVSEGKSIGFSFLLFIVPIFVVLLTYFVVKPLFDAEWIAILSSMIAGVLYFIIIGQIEERLIRGTSIRKTH